MDNLLHATQSLNRQLATALGSPSEKNGIVSALKKFFGRAVTWIQSKIEGKDTSAKNSPSQPKVMHSAYKSVKSTQTTVRNATRKLEHQFRAVETAKAKLNSTHNQSLAIKVTSGSLFDKICAKASVSEGTKASELFPDDVLKSMKKDIESEIVKSDSRLTKLEAAKIAYAHAHKHVQMQVDQLKLDLPSPPSTEL